MDDDEGDYYSNIITRALLMIMQVRHVQHDRTTATRTAEGSIMTLFGYEAGWPYTTLLLHDRRLTFSFAVEDTQTVLLRSTLFSYDHYHTILVQTHPLPHIVNPALKLEVVGGLTLFMIAALWTWPRGFWGLKP